MYCRMRLQWVLELPQACWLVHSTERIEPVYLLSTLHHKNIMQEQNVNVPS